MLPGFFSPAPKPRYNRQIPMDFKRLIQTFTYHIEAKPEGGFIAHSGDPGAPPLEAPTRMELQRKIQAAIAAAMSQQFPGIKLPEGQTAKFDFHIEAKSGGGFIIHSHDPNAAPIAGATHDDIELPFAGKIAGVLGKYFLPEFSEALAQHGSGDMRVTVNKNVTFTTSSFKTAQDAASSLQAPDASPGNLVGNSSDSPITPEKDRSSGILRFLLFLIVVLAAMYFFLHRR
jgi:hypothetical protein